VLAGEGRGEFMAQQQRGDQKQSKMACPEATGRWPPRLGRR